MHCKPCKVGFFVRMEPRARHSLMEAGPDADLHCQGIRVPKAL